MNSSRHKHQSQQRAWKTRAQEESENRQADARYELRRQAEDARIQAAFQAQWDALTPEEQAESEAKNARLREASWAEHLQQEEWREQRDRERRDSITRGT